ncbi:hypothetical protein AMECASPLE_036957 [Ameca splendens]|uniref:Uncharacterized protein n=1 Tax=Ameca splendens TaxID=208324 RepID=A0ABV1A363_9TELE
MGLGGTAWSSFAPTQRLCWSRSGWRCGNGLGVSDGIMGGPSGGYCPCWGVVCVGAHVTSQSSGLPLGVYGSLGCFKLAAGRMGYMVLWCYTIRLTSHELAHQLG